MTPNTFQSDDRAVSIAVTHVLTIGITTILIAGLLVGASGLLESEKQGATRDELRTIGNRMASELSSAYYSHDGASTGSVVVEVSHPEYVAGNNYKVNLTNSDCTAPAVSASQCLVMDTPTGDTEVVIPIDPDIDLKSDSVKVSGGSFYIYVDDSGELTIQSDRPSPSLAPPVVYR